MLRRINVSCNRVIILYVSITVVFNRLLISTSNVLFLSPPLPREDTRCYIRVLEWAYLSSRIRRRIHPNIFDENIS